VAKFKKYLIIIFMIITVAGIWYSIGSYKSYVEINNKSNVEKEEELKPANEMKELHLTLYNKDKSIKWELESNSAIKTEQGLEMIGIKIDVYDEIEGKEIYNFEALKAYYESVEEILEIKGPVKINSENLYLNIDNLIWEQKNDIIKGEGKIIINGPSFIIKGKKFRGNSSLTDISISGVSDRQAYMNWRQE